MTETALKTTYSFPTEDEKEEARIAELEAQVSSLTKEIDDLKVKIKELKNDVEKRMQVADKIFKENRDLQSQLSNREKEIEELKEELNKPTDDILYYHDNPRTPHCDIFWSLNEWPTSKVGLIHRYAVRNIDPIWCVRSYYSYRKFDSEQDAIEYSNTFECKGFRTEQEYLASLNKSKEGEEK